MEVKRHSYLQVPSSYYTPVPGWKQDFKISTNHDNNWEVILGQVFSGPTLYELIILNVAKLTSAVIYTVFNNTSSVLMDFENHVVKIN